MDREDFFFDQSPLVYRPHADRVARFDFKIETIVGTEGVSRDVEEPIICIAGSGNQRIGKAIGSVRIDAREGPDRRVHSRVLKDRGRCKDYIRWSFVDIGHRNGEGFFGKKTPLVCRSNANRIARFGFEIETVRCVKGVARDVESRIVIIPSP